MPEPRYQDLSLFRVPSGFRGRSAITIQVWWIVQATLFAWSPQFLYGWRRYLLRLFGAKIGRKVILRPTVRITYPWKVEIGDYSQIGDRTELYSLSNILIGKNVVVSQDSYICTGGHYPDRLDFKIYADEIIIEDEVWLAAQCFVMPGVVIGRGSFCKVRSLITRNVPCGMILAGAPARIVGPRTQEDLGDSSRDDAKLAQKDGTSE